MMRRALTLLMLAGLIALSRGAAADTGSTPASSAAGANTSNAADTANAANAGSAAPDLDAVMGLLAMRRHGRVEFVEQQFLAILNHPVESSGELRYDAPDRLEKHTLLPHPEDLVLSGGVLTMERGGRSRVLDLQRYPQIQPFVESLRATLAGDRSALERIFHVDFAGSVQRWSLTLIPLDARLARNVKQVRIDGSRDQLLRVEIRQSDGDRSLLTLREPAAP
jgi:Outer membrane lipoprotein carrier protein LolA-like